MVGRDAILRRLRAEVDAGGLVVLNGKRGRGRTAVLTELADTLRADGGQVLFIDAADADPWDGLGAGVLLRALGLRGGAAPVMTAVNLLRSSYTADGAGSAEGRARLRDQLARLFILLAEHVRLVLLIDDVDLLGEPGAMAASFAAAGHPVVVSTTPRGLAESVELSRRARQSVELPPLDDSAVTELIKDLCGGTPSPRLGKAVTDALGTRAGNPAELTAAIGELAAQDRLVTVHARVLLIDAEPVRLPEGHRLVRAVRHLGEPATDLLLLAAGPARMPLVNVSLLAAAGGWSTTRFGQTLDSLVRLGVLTVADGAVGLACPAVVTVLTAGRADRGRQLHAETVRLMLAAWRDGGPFDERLFADHVAAAGTRVRLPKHWPPRLLATAEHDASRHPERAARWLRALRGLLAEPARTGATELLIPLAMRVGDHAWLGRIVAEILGDRPTVTTSSRRTLAVAAALAALHTGHRVPDVVRSALEGAEAIGLSDRWLAGETPGLAEFRSVFAPGSASGTPEGCDRHPLERALAARYPAPALAAVLGPGYRLPERGCVAETGRLCTGYLDGAWAGALDAARELFVQHRAGEPGRELAALLAAEMSTWTVGARAARAWLEEAGPHPAYPLVLAWVRAGTALRANAYDDALAAVCTALRLGRTDCLGLAPLLLRGAIAATLHGRERTSPADLALLRARNDLLAGTDEQPITAALLDPGPARPSTPPAARNRPWNYLATALTDPDPRPWLVAAHEAAHARGATILRGWLRSLMVAKDLRPPPKPRSESGFSARELHIIEQVRAGSTNRQIAGRLALSEKSVENHLAQLFRRTSARSRQELAAMAIDRGQVADTGSPPFG